MSSETLTKLGSVFEEQVTQTIDSTKVIYYH